MTQTVGDVTSAAAPSSSSTSTTTTTTTAPPASPPAPSIAHVTISVGAAEDAPLAGDDAEFTPEDTPLVVAAPGVLINDTDPDNGQLTARLDTPPSQGRLEAFNSDGSFTYQPYHNTTGSDLFTYEAKNQEGKTAIGRVRVLIGPQGDIVLATDDRYEVREDASLTVPAPGVLSNDVDPDGERSKLAVTVTRQPTHGTLEMNQNGSFLYAPAHDYSGLDGFGYQIEDPDHNKATANVVISVTNSGEGPVETTPTTLPGPAATPPTGPTNDVAVVTHNPTSPSASPAAAAPVIPITPPTTTPPPPTVAVLPARHGNGGKFPVVPVGAGAAGALGLAGLAGGLRSHRRSALGPIEHSVL